MIIDCVSDLHGCKPALQGADLLIVAGDLTGRDTLEENMEFVHWFKKQNYRYKILIAGNHDGMYYKAFHEGKRLYENAVYLCDSGTEFEGLKIYGSPWTPEFCDWHFMKPRGEELKKIWDLIPDDTNILITHGPARGILDYSSGMRGSACGCDDLKDAIERIKPGLHVFGHIHECYGTVLLNHGGRDTLHVNAAFVNGRYKPVNKPIRVLYDETNKTFSLL